MKKLLLLCSFALIVCALQAQTAAVPALYNPKADAGKEIKEAVAKAAKENKHVLLQMGGNWCGWCLRFNKFTTEDPQLDSLIKANYVVYHVNYSPENKNKEVFAKYGFPQRFGFPVFVVLDAKGNRIHTQNSAYLEEGQGYDKNKVMEFFKNWAPSALNSATYDKW